MASGKWRAKARATAVKSLLTIYHSLLAIHYSPISYTLLLNSSLNQFFTQFPINNFKPQNQQYETAHNLILFPSPGIGCFI